MSGFDHDGRGAFGVYLMAKRWRVYVVMMVGGDPGDVFCRIGVAVYLASCSLLVLVLVSYVRIGSIVHTNQMKPRHR